MKGKKIKTKTDTFTIVLIMFIIMLVIGIVALSIPSNSQFTIYKNECSNKSGNYSGYRCEDGSLWLPIETYYKEIVLPSGVRCYPNNDTYSTQVCEQKEVEEIEGFCEEGCIDMEYYRYCISQVFHLYDNLPQKEKEDKLRECNIEAVNSYTPNKISKKDLTTSWLEENCECLECISDNGSMVPDYLENSSCDKSNERCSKYSCGEDYVVEVKR